MVSSGTHDPNPDNNSSTVVTPVIPAGRLADLSVTKTSDLNPVQPGSTLTYTLAIFNAGPDAAQNVMLADDIPSSLTDPEFSLDGGITWHQWNGSLNLGTLAAEEGITVLIRAVVALSASGSIINTAIVSSTTPDPDPDNNTSTNRTDISTTAAAADISVTKSARPAAAIPGELLTYTIVVTNNGPDSARNVILYDEVPPELSDVQFSLDGGVVWNTWTNPYVLGTLAAGQSRTILIRGTVIPSSCGIITNTAVAVSTTPDPNPDNNTDTVNTPVRKTGADLSIRKTASPSPAIRCQRLTYTLTINNLGTDTAEQVVITDNLPADLHNPEFSIDGGNTWETWEGSLNIGTLAANSSVSILITGIVSRCAKGCIRNTARVSSSTFDPNTQNNTASVTVNVCKSCNC